MKAISARVTGQVQGVGFRYATARRAGELGLTGWVRNTHDRAVEVWAQGSAEDVEAMVAFLRVGPPAARVDALVAVPGTPNPEITSFAVRY